ncbi:hypothetical protein FRC01_001105 [Tulasnella sp. 417]|nr:hypothetical protein FRC01_001105 [Tulasnella sp. 417]
MSLAAPSAGERFLRIASQAAALAPVPWVPLVTQVIQEVSREPSCSLRMCVLKLPPTYIQIYGLIRQIQLVAPQCKELAQEAVRITRELKNHEEKHPGESKLEDVIMRLQLAVQDIRNDLARWTKYTKFLIYWKHGDVLARIDFHRTQLGSVITDLTFKGVLIQDIQSAQMQITVEAVESAVEEIRQKFNKDEKDMDAAKEDWRTAKLIMDIDRIEAAEDRMIELRLDPNRFPSAEMGGEVTKMSAYYDVQGTSYEIFKAVWLNKKLVAAKRFKGAGQKLTPKDEMRFTRHFNIWRSLKHDNILPVLGICKFEPDRAPYIISGWMKYGDVMNYLKEFSGQKVDKLKLIHEIAIGLEFIHNRDILHGNLNTSNVLVDLNHHVRLTGFSVSKDLQGDAMMTRTNGLFECSRWWSPETIGSRALSKQSDIWSWGMTALEILSEEKPFKQAADLYDVRVLVLAEKVPNPEDYNPPIAKERIWTLMMDCWKPYGSRPEVEYIKYVLHYERLRGGWNPNAPTGHTEVVDPDWPESF